MNMESLSANLYCLLSCLSAVYTDDPEVLESYPQALEVAADYSKRLCEMIIERQEG